MERQYPWSGDATRRAPEAKKRLDELRLLAPDLPPWRGVITCRVIINHIPMCPFSRHKPPPTGDRAAEAAALAPRGIVRDRVRNINERSQSRPHRDGGHNVNTDSDEGVRQTASKTLIVGDGDGEGRPRRAKAPTGGAARERKRSRGRSEKSMSQSSAYTDKLKGAKDRRQQQLAGTGLVPSTDLARGAASGSRGSWADAADSDDGSRGRRLPAPQAQQPAGVWADPLSSSARRTVSLKGRVAVEAQAATGEGPDRQRQRSSSQTRAVAAAFAREADEERNRRARRRARSPSASPTSPAEEVGARVPTEPAQPSEEEDEADAAPEPPVDQAVLERARGVLGDPKERVVDRADAEPSAGGLVLLPKDGVSLTAHQACYYVEFIAGWIDLKKKPVTVDKLDIGMLSAMMRAADYATRCVDIGDACRLLKQTELAGRIRNTVLGVLNILKVSLEAAAAWKKLTEYGGIMDTITDRPRVHDYLQRGSALFGFL